MIVSKDDESCSALGKRYKYILGKCYHFHKARKPNFEAQDRCRVVFGPDVRGHLFEPTSMEVFQLVNTTAAHIFGLGKNMLINFSFRPYFYHHFPEKIRDYCLFETKSPN